MRRVPQLRSLGLVLALAPLLAHGETDRLPGFEDFRRIDRIRRLTGQLQTAELLAVTQIDANRLMTTARSVPDDWQALWGAAELLVEWPNKQIFFEAALASSRTNHAIATRYALFATANRDMETARRWLAFCRQRESDNIVPWLAELWLLTRPVAGRPPSDEELAKLQPALWTTMFRDHAHAAARARIRLLELTGYSPYAARRLGFMPETPAVQFARDLALNIPAHPNARNVLEKTARALQAAAPFLLYEFVGQTLEIALVNSATDSAEIAATRFRAAELDNRREELKQLLATVEQNVIDLATETEMIRYFDHVLTFGEEQALRRLLGDTKSD